MSRNRTAAILVTWIALLCPYSADAATPSRLTPMPPVALAPQAPQPPPSRQRGTAPQARLRPPTTTQPTTTQPTTTIATSTAAGKSTALPRTGTDLPLQALLAAVLLAAGAALRTRVAVARAGRR